jgi:predicted RNase H-like HicB family nuclease
VEAVSSYLIIIEGDGTTNYSAYCPDLPGVIATGPTTEECQAAMTAAMAFHIEGMREAGEPVPAPTSQAATVEVAA